MNQKLEQYLQFFVDHRQNNWPEWLITVKFVVNNKTYSATKVSLFMVNYRRELRIGADIRRRKKVENAMEFTERMKRVQKDTKVVLKRSLRGG